MSLEISNHDSQEENKKDQKENKEIKDSPKSPETEKQSNVEQFQSILSEVEEIKNYWYKKEVGSIGSMNIFWHPAITLRMNGEKSVLVLQTEGDNVLAYNYFGWDSSTNVPVDLENAFQSINEFIKGWLDFTREEKEKIRRAEEKQEQQEIDADLDEKLKWI